METLFTGAAILDFLSQIDELKDKDLNIQQNGTVFQISIGDSTYNILPDDPTDIKVDDSVVDAVADANDDTLEDIVTDADAEVEGGPIINTIKDLLVGGLIRMGSKSLGKNIADGIIDRANSRR